MKTLPLHTSSHCGLTSRLSLVWGQNQRGALGLGSRAPCNEEEAQMGASQAVKGELEWGLGPLHPMLDPLVTYDTHDRCWLCMSGIVRKEFSILQIAQRPIRYTIIIDYIYFPSA